MPSDDVLLVDADPSALGVMAHGLARQGFQVRPVARSEQAMLELAKTVPSLVISDVEPSGADGLRILELMRRDPRTAETPVLLLAKGEWTRRRSEAQQLGAQDLLKKPLFVQDLAVLGRLYAGHSAAEEVFTGDLAELRCTMLLRSLLAGGRSGQLSFDPAGGRIYFQDGQVVDAVLPPLNGERALWRLLTFDQGRYRLRFGPVLRTPILAIDVKELQNRGAEHVRHWEELRAAVGSTDAVLEVDFRRLTGQLEGVSPAVWPLLRLFDGQRSVGQVIDAFGMDDLVGTQAVIKLNTLGLLRPAGSEAERPNVTQSANIANLANIADVSDAPAATVIRALSDVITPEPAQLSAEAAETLEYDPAPPPTIEDAFPEAADLGAALAAVAVEPAESFGEVEADGLPAFAATSLALEDDSIEKFLFGDMPQAETLAAAAAVTEASVVAPPAPLALLSEDILPVGVAVAFGTGETPAPVERAVEELAAAPVAEVAVEESAASSFWNAVTPVERAPQAEAAPASDDLEASFFATLGESTGSEVAAPAVAVAQPAVSTLEQAPAIDPAIDPIVKPVPRWVWVSIGVAAVGVIPIAFLPRAPSRRPTPQTPVAVTPLAPAQILAPAALAKLVPVLPAADRLPEMAKLIEQGQEAYDARQFPQAEEAFQKAAELRPEDPVPQMFLGLSRYEQAKLTEAVGPLEKAHALDSKNGRTDLLLGAVYQELGRTDLARESYEEYLTLDPKGEYVRDVRAILARIARLHAAR